MSQSDDTHQGYTLSTDKSRLDVGLIHEVLSRQAYWAEGRPLEVVQRSIEHSLCFGIYQGAELAAFARVVTDYATFAWLCDVFVLEAQRGRGLGKWLVEAAVTHPDLQGIKLFILATRDAHELYRRYGGFEALPAPERWMVRRPL
jgi:GNAT superfamily N-acetyltransferase